MNVSLGKEPINLVKERKQATVSLTKEKQESKFKNVLVTINWSDKKKDGGEPLDLDLIAVGKLRGATKLQEWSNSNPNTDDVLFYAVKQSKLGKLTDDNRSGKDLTTEQSKVSLAKLGVSASDSIQASFDEALLLNIDNLDSYEEVYLAVASYKNEPFSMLEAYGKTPVVSLSFYDADLGVKVGKDWDYSEQILPDGTGFVVAKLTRKPKGETPDASDSWFVQSLATTIKDETQDGIISIDDVIEAVNKSNI
jgi:hypothetical protein